jgi:hypothetical protein
LTFIESNIIFRNLLCISPYLYVCW